MAYLFGLLNRSLFSMLDFDHAGVENGHCAGVVVDKVAQR